MGDWLHVAAVVRIDSHTIDISKLFGIELDYEGLKKYRNDTYVHPEKYLPRTGDGTLRTSVWINPDTCSCAGATVSIFGDIESGESPQKIIDWFRTKVIEIETKHHLIIRQAVITVQSNIHGTMTWCADDEYQEI